MKTVYVRSKAEEKLSKRAFNLCKEGAANALLDGCMFKDPKILPPDLMGVSQDRYYELVEEALKAFTLGTGPEQERQWNAVFRIKNYFNSCTNSYQYSSQKMYS